MIYFLASIPRSGSTLLASLLEQREDTYVSPTSNLGMVMGEVVRCFQNDPANIAGGCDTDELFRTLMAMVEAKYSGRIESVIFDKGRLWADPNIMATMMRVLGDVKIVATVRPLADCVASFYEIEKSTVPIKEWVKSSQLMEHFRISYNALKNGYEKYPENFCIVEYSDLCNHTQRELDRVADFIGISHVTFSPTIQQVNENDNAWNIKDLHKLEPEIKVTEQDAKVILGDEMYEHFQGGEFWNDKPEPEKGKAPLDLALHTGLLGRLEDAYEILKHEEARRPDCNRTKFNLGSYEMMRGNLLRGHKLLDYGRLEDVFGNKHIGTHKPLWEGQSNCTVLREMEGGFGDQFHCIRYAKMIRDRGVNVVIGGNASLAPIMKDVEGIDVIVAHEGSKYVEFDYWVPAMSAPVPLELEWSDVSGKSYIPRLGESEGKIGVKWAGNPKFEHQQHRLFPKEMMWDAVEGFDTICLQREDDKDTPVECPDWMEQPSLETWNDTRREISKCGLIVTSCSGLAHLAGAMGIETWIVIPVLPYYTWSLPGNTSPHYDSVTLFRQIKHGCWKEPFWNLKKLLRKKMWSTKGETTQQFIEA